MCEKSQNIVIIATEDGDNIRNVNQWSRKKVTLLLKIKKKEMLKVEKITPKSILMIWLLNFITPYQPS